jgi:hypothetical protein
MSGSSRYSSSGGFASRYVSNRILKIKYNESNQRYSDKAIPFFSLTSTLFLQAWAEFKATFIRKLVTDPRSA